ncbi:MAG TPA: hypothetical protein VES73_18860 [Lamprocystis sp. (in: g-proteobacteria)]|nr:hypothetical protein [Lamprocystis sp. (in: g-proteobacteria)]
MAGICYRAAGWELLGETSGSGLARPGRTYHSAPRQEPREMIDELGVRLTKAARHAWLSSQPLSRDTFA